MINGLPDPLRRTRPRVRGGLHRIKRPPDPARPTPELSGLWRQPGFAAFFAAATLGRLADEMRPIAVVLLVLDRTGEPALAGLAVAAGSLPSVLTGPLLGAWLDRTSRRRAALAANQVLTVAGLLGVLAVAGREPAWALLGLALIGGLGAPMLTGGMTSMLQSLVPAGMLVRANAWEAASFNTAAVVGPGLAALVAGGFGAGAAVALEAAAAAASVAAIVRLPRLAPAALPSGGESTVSLGSALRAGFSQLARTPVLRGVTALTTLSLGAQGLLPLALPLLAAALGAGTDAAGYVFAAQEVGAVAGAFTVARIGARWHPHWIVIGGTALLGGGTLGWAAAPSFPALLALGAVAGLAAGPAFAATFAVRQRWAPAWLRAQIFTTAASLKVGAYAVGAALAGPVIAQAGTRDAIVATGMIELLSVATGLALGAAGRTARHGDGESTGEG